MRRNASPVPATASSRPFSWYKRSQLPPYVLTEMDRRFPRWAGIAADEQRPPARPDRTGTAAPVGSSTGEMTGWLLFAFLTALIVLRAVAVPEARLAGGLLIMAFGIWIIW